MESLPPVTENEIQREQIMLQNLSDRGHINKNDAEREVKNLEKKKEEIRLAKY